MRRGEEPAGRGSPTINRVAIITTINRIAIITTINRIAIITTINRIAIITTINRIAAGGRYASVIQPKQYISDFPEGICLI